MITHKHYKDGTTTITADGNYQGYLPSRTESPISIHIIHDEYSIHLDEHAVVINHKYLSIVYQTRFKVGRWSYPIGTIEHYQYNEKKELHFMNSVLDHLVNHSEFMGERITDYTTVKLLHSHRSE